VFPSLPHCRGVVVGVVVRAANWSSCGFTRVTFVKVEGGKWRGKAVVGFIRVESAEMMMRGRGMRRGGWRVGIFFGGGLVGDGCCGWFSFYSFWRLRGGRVGEVICMEVMRGGLSVRGREREREM